MRKLIRSALFCSLLIAKYTQTTSALAPISSSYDEETGEHVVTFENNRLLNDLSICSQFLKNRHANAEGDPLQDWDCCDTSMVAQSFSYQATSNSIKSSNRASVHAGPGQVLDLAQRDTCLSVGDVLEFEVFFMLLTHDDQPYICNTDIWNSPLTCPIMSLGVTKPDGSFVFVNSYNEIGRSDWVPDEWNRFFTTTTVDEMFMQASRIDIRFRGIPKSNKFVISDPSLRAVRPPAPCDQMLVNGDGKAEDPLDGWNCCWNQMISIPQAKFQADGSLGYKSYQHASNSAGPGQYLDLLHRDSCLEVGTKMTFEAHIMTLDSFDQPYVCSSDAWATANTCPIMSFYVTKPGGSKVFKNGSKSPRDDWVDNNWNLFQSSFVVDDVYMAATEINIRLRGIPKANRYLISDARLYVDNPPTQAPITETAIPTMDPTNSPTTAPTHTPTVPPTISTLPTYFTPTTPPTANPTMAATTQHPTFSRSPTNYPSKSAYIAPRTEGCDMLVNNGDFEMGSVDPYPWNVNQGGILSLVSPGAGGSNYSLKVGGRETEHYGPKHPLSIACFNKDAQFEVKANIKLVATTATSRKLQSGSRFDQPGCTEFIVNGLANAADPKEGWDCCENELTVVSPGFSAESNALKSTGRWTVNSGPGQTFDLFSRDACLQPDDKLNFVAYLKTLDANDQPYKCSTDVFNKPNSCPFLSFRITKSDGTKVWKNGYMRGSKEDWVAGEWNHFYTTIAVDQDFLDATEISLRMRGIPAENSILISDASLTGGLEAYTPPTSNPTMSTTVALDESFFRSSSINETTFNETSLNETSPNETSLNETEIVEGIEGEITENGTAPALLSGGNVTESPGSCDPLSPTSMCPILTIHVIYETGEEHKYSPNIALVKWEPDQYNEFHAFFEITEMMTNAIEAYFYFEGPPGGIDMYIDDVVVREFQPLPIGNTHVEGDDWMTSSCDEIVRNGDAETGDTSGWTARLGGRLSIRPEGADGTNFSFEHNARTSFIMGPKHILKTNCFTPGMQYVLNAKMKLLDENGDHFACDKNHTWIDDVSCPILTFELTSMSGAKSWKYFGNMDMEPWDALFWNDFTVPFIVNEEIMNAVEAFFFIERPRAGITIILDQVTIDRDCTKLIAESNAEDNSLLGWETMYGSGGYMAIHPEGHAGSMNSYGFFGRTASVGGPGHPIDKSCLSLGNLYEFKAWIKLFDELNGNQPVDCKKYSTTDTSSTCPALSLVINKSDSTKTLTWQNRDKTTWVPEEFNYFTAVFEVTQEMLDFGNLNLIIKGTRIGVAVLFDDVKIDLYEPPESNCDQLVEDGNFESGNLLNWGFRQSGSMHFYEGGYNNSTQSLICVNREMVGAGCSYELDNSCLVEGKEYMFSAQLKLETENGDPFYCNKDKGSGDDACPMLGFEVTANGTTTVMNKANHHPENWKADDWNYFHTKVTVDHRMAQGNKVIFYFRGPQVGMGVIMDDVHFDIYEPPAQDCLQLITNTNAENDSLMGWQSNDGGFITIRDGGSMGSAHSFVHSHRTGHWMGPKQDIDVGCLEEGKIYEFNAHIKLELEDGTPFACDKSADWKTELTCPLVTIKCSTGTTIKSYYANNLYGVNWLENEFNIYRGEMEVKPEMATAESCYWYIQGPSAGKNIVFDNINLRYVSGP